VKLPICEWTGAPEQSTAIRSRPIQRRPERERNAHVEHVRGVLMLLAAGVAFWKGWELDRGHSAMVAYGLGVLALALAVWHLTRKERRPRG
jgi:hypothetical protein